jgi:histidine triad (HIT) family protein
MENSCFICNKHKGTIKTAGVKIYEDEYVYVGHIDRKGEKCYLGHIMIDLKRHVPTLGDMNIAEAKAFGVIMSRVSKALMDCENAEHVYALVSGDAVPHLHMHVKPRYPDTPKDFWAIHKLNDWPGAPMGDNQQVTELCNRIKSYLENNSHEDKLGI